MAPALRMARFTETPVEDDAEVFLARLVDLRGVLVVEVLLVRFLYVRLVAVLRPLVFFVAILLRVSYGLLLRRMKDTPCLQSLDVRKQGCHRMPGEAR